MDFMQLETQGLHPEYRPDTRLRQQTTTMSRDAIFAKIETATTALKEKAAYPEYDLKIVHSPHKLAGDDLWEIFSRNFKYVNGKAMDSIQQLIEFLQQNKQTGRRRPHGGNRIPPRPLRRLSVRHHPRHRGHRRVRHSHHR
jgi:hypothetical protein